MLRMEPAGRKTYFLNFQARTIRLRRETVKGEKLAYIPMNSTVNSTLSSWKAFMKKRDPGEYLFNRSHWGAHERYTVLRGKCP